MAMGARPLKICTEFSGSELRQMARSEGNGRTAMRMLAIANALDGFDRAEAARLAGMSGQALCDAINRYNSEGLAGLKDRPKSGRPEGRQRCSMAAASRKPPSRCPCS